MGRNKIYKDGKERIGVDLNPEELKAFDEIRWRERMSKTELARIAIVDYIKAHGSGNDTFKLDNWNNDPTFQVMPNFMSDKWLDYYKNCDEQERIKLKIQANHLSKLFPNIDFNENRR